MKIILSFSKMDKFKENFQIEVLHENVLNVLINLSISEMW